jgi:hypothetical protein
MQRKIYYVNIFNKVKDDVLFRFDFLENISHDLPKGSWSL